MFRVLFSIIVLIGFRASAFAADRLVVFTPSSLTEVMGKVANGFEKYHGQKVVLSIGGTSQLARQLKAGAPADIFISADRRWMDWVTEKRLIVPNSRVEFAGNRLVVAVRSETENWVDIEALITQFPFAMGEPDSIPVGQYAREALTHRGWWKMAKTQAVYGENVRVTLRRVALGEVGAAIVYATDAIVEPSVKVMMTFSPESHSPIAYWAAITPRSKKDGEEFINYLGSAEAGVIFAEAGFIPPGRGN